MRKLIWISGIIVVSALALMFSTARLGLRRRGANPLNSPVSPSGKYTLNVYTQGFPFGVTEQGFYVQDLNGEVVFASNEVNGTHFRLYIGWDDVNDAVWLYSGDLGTPQYWEETKFGQESTVNACKSLGLKCKQGNVSGWRWELASRGYPAELRTFLERK
jgi:hypothetical protein